MKVLPQEVYLHGLGKCPDYCYSIDFSWVYENSLERNYVVTGGADSIARVWVINEETFQLEIHSELTGHQLGVNCVRFSPDGLNSIATASDDGKVVIWKHNNLNRWVQAKILNVLDEVICVAWSPCGTMISAAVQREMTHVFNTSSGRLLARLDGHSNRVTGVCWDPLGRLIVSESSDRSVRVYSKKKNGTWYPKALLKDVIPNDSQETSISKWKLLISESHFPNDPTAHFFRRPDFCPDGSMVLIPGGLSEGGSQFATLMFSRRCLVTGQGPSAVFTTPCAPSTAVRFHPRKFVSSQDEISFYVFVVTTVSSFYVMRSDRSRPVAFGTDIHCTAIVDAAWSSDAQILALCSTDGYVTLVKFEPGELGGVPDWDGFLKPVLVTDQDVVLDSAAQNIEASMNTKRKITPIIVKQN